MTRDELIEKLKEMPNLTIYTDDGTQWIAEKVSVTNRIKTKETRCGEETYATDEKIIVIE